MIIENINGLIKLTAEGNNKVTNKKRSFFTDYIYLGKNDNADNYEEVGREIWKNFIEDLSTDYDLLKEGLLNTNTSIVNLEEVTLDVDFRVMVIEMQLDNDQPNPTDPVVLSLIIIKNSMLGGSSVYSLLKKRIERGTYKTKEEMTNMLDLYFYNERITAEEYSELTTLLNSKE